MRVLIAILLILGICAAHANADKRAFIVGVGQYDELTDLQKSVGDAVGYADLFERSLGYEVTTLKSDPKRRDFVASFDQFVRSINPGDEIVFVFSGHGWSDGADNYLSLSDTPRSVSEAVLRAETIAFQQTIMTELRNRRPSMIFAVVDACRDEKYDKLTRSAGSLERGIVRVSANEGELILYSAGAGQTSLDRLVNDDSSPYSVFTRVLLPLLTNENVPLAQIANQARKEVQSIAQSVGHSQRPEMMLGIDLDYCLRGDCDSPAPGEPTTFGTSSNVYVGETATLQESAGTERSDLIDRDSANSVASSSHHPVAIEEPRSDEFAEITGDWILDFRDSQGDRRAEIYIYESSSGLRADIDYWLVRNTSKRTIAEGDVTADNDRIEISLTDVSSRGFLAPDFNKKSIDGRSDFNFRREQGFWSGRMLLNDRRWYDVTLKKVSD